MSANVKIIKNPFEESEEVNLKVKNNTCVKDVEGFDPENSVVYVNGKHQTSDYILKSGDACVIRQYPSAVSATTIATAFFVGIMITAGLGVAEAITVAVTGKGFKEHLKDWLMPKTNTATNKEAQSITQLPSLRGAKNQSALGKSIPLILGKTYFTPYILGGAYNTISGTDGEDEYYHALYLIGYHNLKVEDVGIGLEVLAENKTNPVDNGALAITSTKYPYEYIDPQTQQVVPKKSYYTQLELQQGENEVSIYNCKVVQENFNAELLNAGGEYQYFYFFSARYPKKVEIEFTLGGLIAYNDKGDAYSPEVEVVAEYSLDGGETWLNCSSCIDFEHATGDSKYVAPVDSATVQISYAYDSPSFGNWIFSSLQMTMAEAKTDDIKLQYYNRQGNWVDLLTLSAGDTTVTGTNLEMYQDYSELLFRIVKSSNTSESFKCDIWAGTKTISVATTEGHILFKNQKPQTLRYVLKQNFIKPQMDNCDSKIVSYRIKRINAKSTDTKVVDKIYVTAVRTWCYDKTKTARFGIILQNQRPMNEKERNKTARLGFSIKVTEDLVNSFDTLNLIATSKARTWDSQTHKWSTTLNPTSNPVALTLHAMTGDFRDEAYRYEIDDSGSTPTSDKIDLEDFGAKYEICEQFRIFVNSPRLHIDKRFYCDGVVLNATKSIDLANNILKCCRSNLVLNGKKYGIFMDMAQDLPLLVLNNNNLLSLTYSRNFDEIPDGQQVKYISKENYYQQDTIVVKPYGSAELSSTDKLETVEYPFITDPFHAKAMSLYQQACKSHRLETFVAKVTGEGGLAEVGSLVSIQSDVVLVGIGDGAEITELVTSGNTITGIKTDGRFAVTDTTKEYGVVINIVDTNGQPKILRVKLAPFSATGTYSELTFNTALASTSPIEEGDIISFGHYLNETLETLCTSKAETGDGTYDLTLVNYDPDIYNADITVIDDFDPKVTPPSESGMPISYGDRTVPVTQLDLNAVRSEINQETSELAEAISTLYSNHIITLYKESTLPLDSTGITGTCTYNFSTNGISWEGSNNGWTLTKPVTNNPVYVTSATAFGKQETDDILPNEWATPIQLGLNGTNGVNTCTLNLYKRLSETPSNYPSTLTYNFLTGSLLGEKNGWQESIPEVDETDNAPCWEIHVTALSTTTTDTIDPSEWTSPAKITQDGYSKEEIMSWIEDVQIESPNIYVNPNTGIFAVDDDGIIQAEQSVTIEVKVIQTNEEIDFDFGAIIVPDGFSIVANNHILTLTAQEGTRVTNSYFTIPIIFTRYESNYEYGDTEGNIYVRLNCQDGQWYGDINSVSNLPSQSNNNYFLWTGINTTSTEEVVEGGVFKQNTYYYSNGTKFKEASYVPYGMSIPSPTSETFNSSFGITTVYGGKYHEAKSTVASIPSNPIIGDFFTWTGTDQTSASIVRGGKLLTGCVYKWVGNEWIKDTSAKHRAIAMKELMSVAENKLAQNNSDVIEYVRELITMNIVTENIQVTGEALINSAITAQLTLGKSGELDGFIKSYNYDSTHGFTINADGSAVFNEVTVRGDITANSFTLGESAGITKGTDSSGHSYFGLASDGTLKARNINAVSGSFTGDITANSFTLGASATIIKGTNTSGHSYFGLASDGKLTVRNINAVSGTFAGDITANSFTLGANATITKGQNDTQHPYFGLASDGTLTVRQINGIGGNFENIIITGNSRFYGFISRTTSTYIFPPQSTTGTYDYQLLYLDIQFLFSKLGITENGTIYKFYGSGLTMFWHNSTYHVFVLTSDISMYKDYAGTTYNIEFDTLMFVDKEMKYYNNKVYIKYTPEELQWYSTQSTLRYDTVGDMACGIKV